MYKMIVLYYYPEMIFHIFITASFELLDNRFSLIDTIIVVNKDELQNNLNEIYKLTKNQ